MSKTQTSLEQLKSRLEKDDGAVAQMLVEALKKAKDTARQELEPTLFDALDWPETLDEYYDHVQRMSHWMPRQSDNPAWQKSSAEESYQQEVSDRVSHFYRLISQKVGAEEKELVENVEWFHDWLLACAREWGSFLDTPESFNDEILQSFIENSPQYHVEDSMVDGRPNNPSGWLTFNQFFARNLNPGLRPISDPGNNGVVTSPADCHYNQHFGISDQSEVPAVTVKNTHDYGSIMQLIEGSRYEREFANGTLVHYYLPPNAYHRFHVPVAGTVRECYRKSGRVYMGVGIHNGGFNAHDKTQSGFEFSQARGILTLDTADAEAGNLGIVAVIPVGMGRVSSVNMTAAEGSFLRKGDEFGYFLFGASDIMILFQQGVEPDIDTSDTFHHYGTPIVRCKRL